MPATSWLPLVAVLPVQPVVAAHEVAFDELQISVEAPPLAIDGGLAVTVTTGCVTTVTVAVPVPVPPVPLQLIEYVVVLPMPATS